MIKKAVFPIAGMGTRFLPATKASAKEMLPIVDKPLIQYAVEEAYSAGIRQMIFVTGRAKRSIEDHFDTSYELERELELAGKENLLNMVRAIIPTDMSCTYVRQSYAWGLGHAVLCAKELIGGDAFAVLLPDDLMLGEPPILTQMINHYNLNRSNILAVQNVALEDTNQYGIVDGQVLDNGLVDVVNIVEKPSPDIAPSTLAVAGRYIFNASIFEELKNIQRGVGGEIQLTDAIARLLTYEKVLAYRYKGRRYDCGNKLGFLQANVDLGLKHSQVGEDFSTWLEHRLNFNCI